MLAPDRQAIATEAGEGEQQRAAPRFQLMLRPARLICREAEYLGLIRDISANGAKIQFFHPVPEACRMAMELREDMVVEMERRWATESSAGYEFASPIDVERVLQPDPSHPRRKPRLCLPRPMILTVDGHDVPARLHNISQQGACIECDYGLARYQLIRIHIDGIGQRHAKVLWHKQGRYGLVLEETFELREFACLLAALSVES